MNPAKIFSLQPDYEKIKELELGFEISEEDLLPADESEKEAFINRPPSVSYWKDAWRRLKANKVAMVALGFIIATLIFAFIGPMFMSVDYTTQLKGMEKLPPSIYFPFGTDNLGRNLLVRAMYATRVSMLVGIFASMIVLVIGTIYGAIAGYFGGKIDMLMMRFTDLIYSVPDVLVIILISITIKDPIQTWANTSDSPVARVFAVLGAGLIAIFLAFGMLYWVSMARIIRGQVMMLKQQEYITAVRALGGKPSRIIFRHLFPNCIGQIIVVTALQIPSAIFLESFLSFLGIGVNAPMTSLGAMASDALSGIYSYPYRLIIPAILLSLIILSLNLFSDGLRDALDPRLKK